MKPPYTLNHTILKLISAISIKLGEINASYLDKQSPQLRKQNKIKTIHSSLSIEGNTLSIEQVSAIIDKKKVIGSKKDILEVLNAIQVYDAIKEWRADSKISFLTAHKMLMSGLVRDAGKFRKQAVGITHGKKLSHVAPPYENIPYLMENLFNYIKYEDELSFIKSCVFHYELEFIHPFMDGNGRMGRLWQTVILLNEYPVFEFLPLETLIQKTQKDYYNSLSASDKSGNSTKFIEYMLSVIDQSLSGLLKYNQKIMTSIQRLEYFLQLGKDEFTRKDYMNVFKDISTATASRDLLKATEFKWIVRRGEKNKTRYSINK
jgi:Fic family protein